MTAESLDALAACLIAYLERVGKTLAISTEASGRSSAHCHVLDSIRAVELCTCAAVQRVHRDGADAEQGKLSSSGNGAISSSGDPQEELSWKGLAAFCFGPQWHMSSGIPTLAASAAAESIEGAQQQQDQQDQSGQSEEAERPLEASASAAGGKVGPSATPMSMSMSIAAGETTVQDIGRSSGWSAPYPDEIPAFPVSSSSRIANPHPLHAPYLHGRPEATAVDVIESGKVQEKTGDDLEEIPDAFFGWGDLGAKEKPSRTASETPAAAGSKRKEITPDKESEPPRKKSKRSGNDSGDIPAEQNPTAPYVPSFYPAFPRPSDSLARTVLDAEAPPLVSASKATAASAAPKTKAASSSQTDSEDPSLKVRSALVQLGQHTGSTYWGSGWDAPANEKKRASELAVPVGRNAEAGGPAPQHIVPLVRASGHPVSRILEGSMDAATMQ
jgi:hypothetical protein